MLTSDASFHACDCHPGADLRPSQHPWTNPTQDWPHVTCPSEKAFAAECGRWCNTPHALECEHPHSMAFPPASVPKRQMRKRLPGMILCPAASMVSSVGSSASAKHMIAGASSSVVRQFIASLDTVNVGRMSARARRWKERLHPTPSLHARTQAVASHGRLGPVSPLSLSTWQVEALRAARID